MTETLSTDLPRGLEDAVHRLPGVTSVTAVLTAEQREQARALIARYLQPEE